MSGIAGLFRRDGAPIEPRVLEALLRPLSMRGPDARMSWCCDSFALLHTHLATDPGLPANQPFSLDGQTWVTADARIDARRDLVRQLGLRGVSVDSSDAELIWHAYRQWGEACPEHLLGDFAFIIVDTRQRRLVCARDQLGVKSLFYSISNEWIVVSNMLDCVRQYAPVDSRLDDSFLADFLLHGWNTNVEATVYQNIRRLAPAHVMECTAETIRRRRYWQLKSPPEDQQTKARDHVARFTELFQEAVSDRLRNQPACVSLSGGKDSTSVAAMASRLTKRQPAGTSLQGVCAVYDRIIPDRERHFAGLAAQSLGMPVAFVVCDDLPVFDTSWETPSGQTPEPSNRANAVQKKVLEVASNRSRILLSGEGGDEALRPASQYYQKMFREGRWLRWAADCARHVWTLRGLPPVGLRTLLFKRASRHTAGRKRNMPTFPRWLNPELVQSQRLHDRWEQFWNGDKTLVASSRPGGYSVLATYLLPHVLGLYDNASLVAPIEYRFPFFDLRVIEFCWSLPPIPLRFDKQILQRAFAKQLPREVLGRRKQGLAGDPLQSKPVRVPVGWEECLRRTPKLREYVTSDPSPAGDFAGFNPSDRQAALAVFELESWMHHKWPMQASGL